MRLVKSAVLVALFNIRANLSRSTIICFSIFLGIASVLVMLSLLRGMDAQIKEGMMQNGGFKIIHVDVIKPQNKRQALQFARSPGLLPHQIERAEHEVEGIDYAIPRTHIRGQSTILYGQYSLRTNVTAVGPNYFRIYATKYISDGRVFTHEDAQDERKVCIIGYWLRKTLFKDKDWRGKKVVIKNVPFEVIGILGDWENNRYGGVCFIPISIYWSHIGSKSQPVSKCEFIVKDIDQINQTKKALSEFLEREHRGVKDFRIANSVDMESMMRKQQAAARIMTTLIGMLALVIGAIGIANIMASSINENIRDIGILKTFGASNIEIFIQYLTEIIILSIIGAAAGCFGGTLLIFLPENDIFKAATLFWTDYVRTVVIACSVGLVSGFMPALFAARLSPAQAIGYRV